MPDNIPVEVYGQTCNALTKGVADGIINFLLSEDGVRFRYTLPRPEVDAFLESQNLDPKQARACLSEISSTIVLLLAGQTDSVKAHANKHRQDVIQVVSDSLPPQLFKNAFRLRKSPTNNYLSSVDWSISSRSATMSSQKQYPHFPYATLALGLGEEFSPIAATLEGVLSFRRQPKVRVDLSLSDVEYLLWALQELKDILKSTVEAGGEPEDA